jgi:hypothetical protein
MGENNEIKRLEIKLKVLQELQKKTTIVTPCKRMARTRILKGQKTNSGA